MEEIAIEILRVFALWAIFGRKTLVNLRVIVLGTIITEAFKYIYCVTTAVTESHVVCNKWAQRSIGIHLGSLALCTSLYRMSTAERVNNEKAPFLDSERL